MERIEGAERPIRRHVGGQVADCRAQLPYLAADPQRVELASGVGETLLREACLLPHPQQGAGRFDKRQARCHEHPRGADARLDFRCGPALEDGPQGDGGVEIEARAP